MQKRHRHALELGVNPNTGIEQIMENCSIVIIESVELDQPWSKIWRLTCKTLDKQGGMNRREDRKRLGSYSGQCAQYICFVLLV